MKRKAFCLALALILLVTTLIVSGCGDTSNLAGAALLAAEEVQNDKEQVIQYSDDQLEEQTEETLEEPEEQTNEPVEDEEQPVEESEPIITYVLNTNTKKFHYEDCYSVRQMKDKNKKIVEATRDEVIDLGYAPCGNCNP